MGCAWSKGSSGLYWEDIKKYDIIIYSWELNRHDQYWSYIKYLLTGCIYELNVLRLIIVDYERKYNYAI